MQLQTAGMEERLSVYLYLCPLDELGGNVVCLPLGNVSQLHLVFGGTSPLEEEAPPEFKQLTAVQLFGQKINDPHTNELTYTDHFGEPLRSTYVWEIKRCCPLDAAEKYCGVNSWGLAAFRYLHTLPNDTKVVIFWV